MTADRRRLLWFRHPIVLIAFALTAAGSIAIGVDSWPYWYLRKARAELSRRDYEAARASLLRYLRARPTSTETLLLLAQLERRMNNYADAGRHLEACARLGGSADEIELERGLAAIQNGVYNAELDALCSRHLARKDADEFMILEALSQGLTKTYRLKEALICLERMLILQPDSNYAFRRRAWIHEQGEDYDRAEADYRRAVEIDPKDAVARLGLANVLLYKRQNGREAADHFERLWSGQQDSAVALGLGRSWYLDGRIDDSCRLLDAWLTDHPGDAQVLAERAEIALNAQQNPDKAEALLRRSIAVAPYLVAANYTLYLCLSRQGRKAEADECQARIQRAKKDRERLAEQTRQLTTGPDNPELRCQIAEMFLRYGDEEGLRWLLLNVQNHPDHRPSHLALAEYYEKQGQSARAAEHRRLAGALRNGK